MEQDFRRRALDALETLQALLLGLEPEETNSPTRSGRREMLACAATCALEQRRQRRQILGHEIGNEQCWEILLTLYANWTKGGRISVTDLSHETGIPSATVTRWLSVLVDRKQVCRDADPYDGRRIWLRLTHEAIEKVERVLTAQSLANVRLRSPLVRAA